MAQQQNGSGGNIGASATNNANSLILHAATEFAVEGLEDNSPQGLSHSDKGQDAETDDFDPFNGVPYLGVVDDQQPSQLQDLTGQGLYQTDSLVRNHGAIPGGSGFMPLALPVPQSLPCLPHNMLGVEASHFMTFLWLHACWKPE